MNQEARYWRDEARESLETAKVLLRENRYLESAFFCHLATEKMLKALVVEHTTEAPPRSHNLLLLAQVSGVDRDFDEKMKSFLAEVAPFQIEGRYPMERKRLLEENPPERFDRLYEATREAISWLDLKLK